MIAPPTSAETAVGSPTTSSTRAVQLSALPESSAAATSARAVSSGAERSRKASAMLSSLKDSVHAVAAQEKAVVQRHRLGRVVQPHLRLDAERAGQHARLAGAALAR